MLAIFSVLRLILSHFRLSARFPLYALCRKRGDAKGGRSLFSVSVTVLVTTLSLVLDVFGHLLLPIPFCLPPFAAG